MNGSIVSRDMIRVKFGKIRLKGLNSTATALIMALRMANAVSYAHVNKVTVVQNKIVQMNTLSRLATLTN